MVGVYSGIISTKFPSREGHVLSVFCQAKIGRGGCVKKASHVRQIGMR